MEIKTLETKSLANQNIPFKNQHYWQCVDSQIVSENFCCWIEFIYFHHSFRKEWYSVTLKNQLFT